MEIKQKSNKCCLLLLLLLILFLMPEAFMCDLLLDSVSLQKKDPKLIKKKKQNHGPCRHVNSNMPDLVGVQLVYTEI